MGIEWFVVAVFLLSLATYLMAFFIHVPRERLLDSERKEAHETKTTFFQDKDDIPPPPMTEPKAPPNIWRYNSEFRQSWRKIPEDTSGEGEEKQLSAESAPQ
jgi:hypothetical protein